MSKADKATENDWMGSPAAAEEFPDKKASGEFVTKYPQKNRQPKIGDSERRKLGRHEKIWKKQVAVERECLGAEQEHIDAVSALLKKGIEDPTSEQIENEIERQNIESGRIWNETVET